MLASNQTPFQEGSNSGIANVATKTPVTEEAIYQDGRDLGFSDNAVRVIEKRYLLRDEEGNIVETPKGMYRRVAKALAEVERNYGANDDQVNFWTDKFYGILSNFQFTPAGRTVANAGGPTKLVANCIVLHFEDSMDSIFSTLKDATLLQQAGSGLGFPWHLLRPAGTMAKRTRGVSSGPVSFLDAFNKAFGVVKQQGRHGANMGVMRIDHPDILEFIDSKKEEGALVNFNISLGLTDEFMQKVKSNDPSPWMCEWNSKKVKPSRIIRNNRGAYVSHEEVDMSARELMDYIVNAAWKNGEPGVLFPDAANRSNPVPHLGRLEATNPCGEQWLHDGDVCNLGSLNLAKFVKDKTIDVEKLRSASRIATRMLDNVIDLADFPSEKVNQCFLDNRRVGLGIMGFADMLYQMGVPYNSKEGVAIAEKVMTVINEASHEESESLAKQKGNFPNWEKSIYGVQGQNRPHRNAALTTVAPTGSISMLFDCSSGIEPFFALAYYKEVMGGDKLPYFNPYLEAELKRRGLYSEELLADVAKTGTLQHRTELPEDLRQTFVTAMDISADDHIAMQSAFQRHVDNSISKTINFPNSATKEDVLNGYISAWEADCKGCTVYRDGSRDEQVLNLNDKKPAESAESQSGGPATLPAEGKAVGGEKVVTGTAMRTPRPRPVMTTGSTYKIKTGYGDLYVTINHDGDGKPFEVFATIGKTGGVFAAKSESICRLISLSLRSGIDPKAIIKQLKGIRGPMPAWGPNGMILSIPDAIAQVFEEYFKKDQQQLALNYEEENSEVDNLDSGMADTTVDYKEPTSQTEVSYQVEPTQETTSVADVGYSPQCPDCSNLLEFSEGCMTCKACGYSKCG